MVHRALEVAEKLSKDSINVGVIDLYRLKPVNVELLLKAIGKATKIVTLEEHVVNGGLGSIVSEIISDNGKTLALKRFAIPDKYFYAYGGRDHIQALCGLDADSVSKEIRKWIKIS